MLYARIDDALSNPAQSTVRTKVGQPRNLRHTNISTKHVRIEWKRPKGQINPRYRLICSCKKGGTEFELPANQTQITINELKSGTTYTVTLYGVYENEYSKPVKYSFTTVQENQFRPAYQKEEYDVKVITAGNHTDKLEPHVLLVRQYNQLKAPQDLDIINQERTVVAKWTAINGAAGYIIELFESNLTIPSLFQIPGDEVTTVAIEDYLIPGKQYRIKIYTLDQNGQRSAPFIRDFEAQLRAPSDVYIIDVGHEHIEIGWKSGAHPYGYVIVVENISSMEVKKYYTEGDTIEIKDLLPSNAYKLTIMMKSATGKLGRPTYFLVTTAADPPSDFTALKTTHEAVKLSWIPPISKVSEYRLSVERLPEAENQVERSFQLPANLSTYVVSDLVDGQTYRATLQSIPVVVSINSPPTIVSVDFVTTLAPPAISKKYIDSESFTFAWEEPRISNLPFAMRYLSSQDTVPDTEFTEWIRFPHSQTSYTLTSLLPATKYFLEGRFESDNFTSESTFIEFETQRIYVPPVVNPTVTSITYSEATIIWDEPKVESGVNIDGYTITYGPDDADRITEPLRVSNDDTIFDLDNLDEDTNYSVLITMIADGIKSDPVWVHFQTLLAPPQDLAVEFVGNEMAIITWEESSASVSQYRVQYAEKTTSALSPEAYQKSWNTMYVSGELTTRLSDLKPNTEYEIEVSAKQSSNGKYTEPATIAIYTLPSPVTGFEIDKWSFDSVKASWNAHRESIDYFELKVIEVDTDKQVSFTKLSSSKTSTSVDNLQPSKWYRVEIAAVSQNQRSAWRHKKVHTELLGPQEVEVSNITSTGALITWSQVSRATSTQVTYRDQTTNKKRSVTVHKGGTFAQLEKLYPGTSYKLEVTHSKSGITSNAFKTIFQTTIKYDTPTLKMRLLREDSAELVWLDQYDRLEEIYHLKWRKTGDDQYEGVNTTSNSFLIPNLTPSTSYEAAIQVTRQNGTLTDEYVLHFTTLEVLLPVKVVKIKEVAEYSTSLEWEIQGQTAERFVLNQEGPFSERKHIVMANHEKQTASTKLKNLIPNMPYKVRITAERLGRQSSEKVIEFRTLPKLKEPDALMVNYTTSDGIYASWHIPYAEHVDGAVLSVYEKKLTGHGPVATVHLMKNETEKYISGLKFETKYRISLYAVRGEATTAKREVSCRTEIDVKPIEKCKIVDFTESTASGSFTYGHMKRKPKVTAVATIVNTPIKSLAILRDRANDRSFQFEALQPNTTYIVSVQTSFGMTETKPCLTEFTTLSKLQPPYEMAIRKVSNDSFSLSWKDLTSDISGYKVRIKKLRENKVILEKDIPSVRKSLKMSGLLPAIRYRIELATLRQDRKSKYSSISITTLPNPPSVTGIVFYKQQYINCLIFETAVLVLRKPDHDISGYIIYYNELYGEGERKDRLIHGIQQRVTVHKLRGLFAGATYNIGVVSIAQSMKSVPANTTATLIPGPLEKLRVRNLTDHSCQLLWRVPETNRSEFINIHLESMDKGTWEKASDLKISSNRSSISLLPLKPGRKYRATITVTRGHLASSSVQTVFKTLIDPPEFIELMSVERYTARVSWSDPVAVDDVVEFRLQYQPNVEGVKSPIKTIKLPAEMRSYDFTDLTEGTPYRIWLTSIGVDSESAPKSVDFHTRIYNFRRPESCVHVKKNGYDQDGIYNIFIGPQLTESHAYCKQKIHDGGWQVIQQRLYQEPYNIPLMSQYQKGFGRADGDYWIGLDAMAQITAIPHELLIQIRDRFGYTMEIRYAFIRVNPAEFGYALQLGEKISGDLPDEFSRLNSLTFSAFDHNRSSNCEDPSGWWHPRDCFSVNLNLAMGSSLPRIRYPNLERYPEEFEIAEASMMIRPIRAK